MKAKEPERVCASCGGERPPRARKGPPATYCSPKCRKDAEQAKRRKDRREAIGWIRPGRIHTYGRH